MARDRDRIHRHIVNTNAIVADSSTITLILYYNGKRKYLKSIAPPRVAQELLHFIAWKLTTYPDLEPTSEAKELESP